jgi:hypothetical protein
MVSSGLWSMIHIPSRKNNYIFIYFEMPLQIDDINPLLIFSFIQIDISHKL